MTAWSLMKGVREVSTWSLLLVFTMYNSLCVSRSVDIRFLFKCSVTKWISDFKMSLWRNSKLKRILLTKYMKNNNCNKKSASSIQYRIFSDKENESLHTYKKKSKNGKLSRRCNYIQYHYVLDIISTNLISTYNYSQYHWWDLLKLYFSLRC